MARRILHLITLALLILFGPAQAMVQALVPPPTSCCCGDHCPCGMPKAPCAPRCPQTGAGQGLVAPVAVAARAQAAQKRDASPRREPSPWPPVRSDRAQALAAHDPGSPANGPPPRTLGDAQAELRQFRI